MPAVAVQAAQPAPDTGAVLKYASNKTWGFLTLTIDEDKITGLSREVDRNGDVTDQKASFEYSAKPIILADPKSVPTL